MSPNLFDNNVKQSDNRKNSSLIEGTNGDKLTATGDFLEDKKGCQSSVPNDQSNGSIHVTMDQNNSHPHTKLRNNVKAENLKSKIDFLIMSKTGMAPAPEEEEAEDIQSIQAEINNMLGGKVSPSIARPGMDVKNSSKTKPGGMDLTKPPAPAMGGTYQSNHHSPLHSNTTTTVEKVEHLLESMFSDSKPSPIKSMPMDCSSKSSMIKKTTTTPRQSLEKLSNEAIENILRTPSPVDDEMEDVKPHIRPSNSSNNRQQPIKPNNTNSRNNTTSNSNHSLDSNHHESNNLHPPSSLSSPHRPPGHLVSSPSKPPLPSTRYSGRTRKKSSLSLDDDDSSNDSTKLEIIDESFINHSGDLADRSDKHNATPSPTRQRSNRSANRNLLGGRETDVQAVKSNGEANETSSSHSSSTKPSIENKIKQEPLTSSPNSTHHTNIKPSITPSKNPIMAVENELEKMFAGIVKEEEDEAPTIKLESLTTKKENSAVTDNAATRKRRTSGERSNRRRSSEFFPSSPEHSTNQSTTPPKKKKKRNLAAVKNTSGSKKKSGSSQGHSSNNRHSVHAKDTSNDSTALNKSNPTTARIAPFIRVYHNNRKDTTIVNSVARIRDEDSGSVVVAGTKKPAGFVPHKKMRSSAQSNLQPANRTDVLDPTWTCVFCKRGPNTYGSAGNPLGDLFGPYRVAAPRETYLDGDEFKRRVNRTSGGGTSSKQDNVKKKRTVSTDVDTNKLTAGLTRVFPADKDSSTSNSNSAGPSTSSKSSAVEYEIWFHEPCIVWGSGCYLVGSALMGLDQCVWSALNSICVNCGEMGASIGCVKSKCRSSVHYSCALHIGWYLDPSTFIATCSAHRDKYDAGRYLPYEESQDDEGSASEDL
uniref:Uncharacterized protein CG5098 n=1 Tax=Cacopsylla melanoneura TaxID=428564 RepID=A0A8D9DZ39_9HEMI